MLDSFLQARLWASPSCRNEALGQHSCNSLPRRVEKTPLYRAQMGEDPRECCRGTSRGFLRMKKCSLASQKIPPSFLPVQVWVKVDCGSDQGRPEHLITEEAQAIWGAWTRRQGKEPLGSSFSTAREEMLSYPLWKVKFNLVYFWR